MSRPYVSKRRIRRDSEGIAGQSFSVGNEQPDTSEQARDKQHERRHCCLSVAFCRSDSLGNRVSECRCCGVVVTEVSAHRFLPPS